VGPSTGALTDFDVHWLGRSHPKIVAVKSALEVKDGLERAVFSRDDEPCEIILCFTQHEVEQLAEVGIKAQTASSFNGNEKGYVGVVILQDSVFTRSEEAVLSIISRATEEVRIVLHESLGHMPMVERAAERGLIQLNDAIALLGPTAISCFGGSRIGKSISPSESESLVELLAQLSHAIGGKIMELTATCFRKIAQAISGLVKTILGKFLVNPSPVQKQNARSRNAHRQKGNRAPGIGQVLRAGAFPSILMDMLKPIIATISKWMETGKKTIHQIIVKITALLKALFSDEDSAPQTEEMPKNHENKEDDMEPESAKTNKSGTSREQSNENTNENKPTNRPPINKAANPTQKSQPHETENKRPDRQPINKTANPTRKSQPRGTEPTTSALDMIKNLHKAHKGTNDKAGEMAQELGMSPYVAGKLSVKPFSNPEGSGTARFTAINTNLVKVHMDIQTKLISTSVDFVVLRKDNTLEFYLPHKPTLFNVILNQFVARLPELCDNMHEFILANENSKTRGGKLGTLSVTMKNLENVKIDVYRDSIVKDQFKVMWQPSNVVKGGSLSSVLTAATHLVTNLLSAVHKILIEIIVTGFEILDITFKTAMGNNDPLAENLAELFRNAKDEWKSAFSKFGSSRQANEPHRSNTPSEPQETTHSEHFKTKSGPSTRSQSPHKSNEHDSNSDSSHRDTKEDPASHTQLLIHQVLPMAYYCKPCSKINNFRNTFGTSLDGWQLSFSHLHSKSLVLMTQGITRVAFSITFNKRHFMGITMTEAVCAASERFNQEWIDEMPYKLERVIEWVCQGMNKTDSPTIGNSKQNEKSKQREHSLPGLEKWATDITQADELDSLKSRYDTEINKIEIQNEDAHNVVDETNFLKAKQAFNCKTISGLIGSYHRVCVVESHGQTLCMSTAAQSDNYVTTLSSTSGELLSLFATILNSEHLSGGANSFLPEFLNNCMTSLKSCFSVVKRLLNNILSFGTKWLNYFNRWSKNEADGESKLVHSWVKAGWYKMSNLNKIHLKELATMVENHEPVSMIQERMTKLNANEWTRKLVNATLNREWQYYASKTQSQKQRNTFDTRQWKGCDMSDPVTPFPLSLINLAYKNDVETFNWAMNRGLIFEITGNNMLTNDILVSGLYSVFEHAMYQRKSHQYVWYRQDGGQENLSLYTTIFGHSVYVTKTARGIIVLPWRRHHFDADEPKSQSSRIKFIETRLAADHPFRSLDIAATGRPSSNHDLRTSAPKTVRKTVKRVLADGTEIEEVTSENQTPLDSMSYSETSRLHQRIVKVQAGASTNTSKFCVELCAQNDTNMAAMLQGCYVVPAQNVTGQQRAAMLTAVISKLFDSGDVACPQTLGCGTHYMTSNGVEFKINCNSMVTIISLSNELHDDTVNISGGANMTWAALFVEWLWNMYHQIKRNVKKAYYNMFKTAKAGTNVDETSAQRGRANADAFDENDDARDREAHAKEEAERAQQKKDKVMREGSNAAKAAFAIRPLKNFRQPSEALNATCLRVTNKNLPSGFSVPDWSTREACGTLSTVLTHCTDAGKVLLKEQDGNYTLYVNELNGWVVLEKYVEATDEKDVSWHQESQHWLICKNDVSKRNWDYCVKWGQKDRRVHPRWSAMFVKEAAIQGWEACNWTEMVYWLNDVARASYGNALRNYSIHKVTSEWLSIVNSDKTITLVAPNNNGNVTIIAVETGAVELKGSSESINLLRKATNNFFRNVQPLRSALRELYKYNLDNDAESEMLFILTLEQAKLVEYRNDKVEELMKWDNDPRVDPATQPKSSDHDEASYKEAMQAWSIKRFKLGLKEYAPMVPEVPQHYEAVRIVFKKALMRCLSKAHPVKLVSDMVSANLSCLLNDFLIAFGDKAGNEAGNVNSWVRPDGQGNDSWNLGDIASSWANEHKWHAQERTTTSNTYRLGDVELLEKNRLVRDIYLGVYHSHGELHVMDILRKLPAPTNVANTKCGWEAITDPKTIINDAGNMNDFAFSSTGKIVQGYFIHNTTDYTLDNGRKEKLHTYCGWITHSNLDSPVLPTSTSIMKAHTNNKAYGNAMGTKGGVNTGPKLTQNQRFWGQTKAELRRIVGGATKQTFAADYISKHVRLPDAYKAKPEEFEMPEEVTELISSVGRALANDTTVDINHDWMRINVPTVPSAAQGFDGTHRMHISELKNQNLIFYLPSGYGKTGLVNAIPDLTDIDGLMASDDWAAHLDKALSRGPFCVCPEYRAATNTLITQEKWVLLAHHPDMVHRNVKRKSKAVFLLPTYEGAKTFSSDGLARLKKAAVGRATYRPSSWAEIKQFVLTRIHGKSEMRAPKNIKPKEWVSDNIAMMEWLADDFISHSEEVYLPDTFTAQSRNLSVREPTLKQAKYTTCTYGRGPTWSKPSVTKTANATLNAVTTRLYSVINLQTEKKHVEHRMQDIAQAYFRPDWKVLAAAFQNELLYPDGKLSAKWIHGRGGGAKIAAEVKQAFDECFVGTQMNQYNVHAKVETLTKVDENAWRKFDQRVRIIVWQPKLFACIFGPMFLEAKRRLKMLFADHVTYTDGLTPQEINHKLGAVPVEHIAFANDLSKQDRQTNWSKFEIEAAVYNLLGVHPLITKAWLSSHKSWRLKGAGGLRGNMDGMRATGEATTSLGNTINNMDTHAAYYAARRHIVSLILFLGDDMLAFGTEFTGQKELKEDTGRLHNMISKPHTYEDMGDFCQFLVYKSYNGWTLCPNFVRLCDRFKAPPGTGVLDQEVHDMRALSYCHLMTMNPYVRHICKAKGWTGLPKMHYDMMEALAVSAKFANTSIWEVEDRLRGFVKDVTDPDIKTTTIKYMRAL